MVLPVYFFFFLFSVIPLCSASSEDCPSLFHCGYLGNLSFPLTTPQRNDCGMLPIHGCTEHHSAEKSVYFGGKRFQVTGWGLFNHGVYVRLTDADLEKRLASESCDALCWNITLPPSSPLGSFYIFRNITMYKCNSSLNYSLSKQFLNYTGCSKSHNETIFFGTQDKDDPLPSLATCPRVHVPVNKMAFSENPFTFMASEFPVDIYLSDDCYRCSHHNKGVCRLNGTGGLYCSKFKDEAETEYQNKRRATKLGLHIGVAGVGLGILTIALVLCFRLYKQKRIDVSHVKFRSTNQYPINEEDPDGGRLFFGVPIFSYKELQEATNNFNPSNKLGDGGFGSVYHGKIQDGREVAVKHLFNHNYKRVEQFMTEVEILTRLCHTNLVSLYGCTSRQSRELLLVYEYIPNGTLASHLHNGSVNPRLLTWPIRIKIAIETATALSYLHASGIIHRDVKTNNILLDKTFCVKVADFGLSRLFPDDVSHVSTGPQGTPGYLDPEYHYCFRLNNKSDVYSFGVVLMELISSMPAVDMRRNNDEITLANLAVKKIQRNEFEELVDPYLRIENDSEVKKQVVALGGLAFQCLQIDRKMRPSIDEVLDILREIECVKEEDKDAREDDDGEISKKEAGIHEKPMTSISFNQVKLFKSASSPNKMNEKWSC